MSRLLTLHDPLDAQSYYRTGLWCDDTLYSLVERWAAERGDAGALRDPRRRLTWSGVKAEADAVAATLRAAGLREGDRVSVWMGNRIESVIVFLACSRNGYVFNTSLHHTYTVEEVAGLLDRVSCRALFAQVGHGADADRADIFERAASLPSMRAVFALSGSAHDTPIREGARAYPQVVSSAEQPAPVRSPDKVVYLAFTSGTTGAPKGVMHSDNTLLANARSMVRDWHHDSQTVLLTLSQMSHHIGTVALDQALAGGFELVLHDAAAGIDPIEWIEQTGATYVMGVPTHAIDILAALKKRGVERLGRVSTFYLAGAPIPTETASRLLEMGIRPQNVYGMTENGSHQYTRPGDATATITATCGKACDAYEVKLFKPDDPDVEVAPGEVGEIGGRGAMRMLGYFANQAATESAFNRDGWFMSGDLGRFDENGDLQIVGRVKDIIIRGGHNVHPARIEDLAMRHPGVMKAAAVPVADDRLGERVCLVITTGPADAPSAMELLFHLHEAGLSKFDMPEYFGVLEALPLGATGKVLKRELVRWIREGHVTVEPIRWRAEELAR
ncbi:class I adenylate-forming enzyme family protein [Steroidobacter flavus]|uniref:Class I adenylate-forming enzyme family protein n=1 Tax=Steroidobacter flavus TaxID=1842136 RepID=A0ABV8SXP5_9GAMM